MTGRYDRGLNRRYVDFIHNGEKNHISLDVISQLLGITAITRVRQDELRGKISTGSEYMHFGLPVYDMHRGDNVLVAPIVQNGIFRDGVEQLPVLSLSGAKRAIITHIEYCIEHEKISENIFLEPSIGNIQSKPQLLDVVYHRYHEVLGLSRPEIKKMGVSIRKLKIVGNLSKTEKELFE